MSDKITYYWGNDHLQIKLGKRLMPRIRALFWAEFVVTTGMATIFLVESFYIQADLLRVLSYIGASVLYLLASYRFISRMFFVEELWLDEEYLTIVNSTPFSRTIKRYDWPSVGPLHYVGSPTKTAHPLKGECYDYFGFETQEQLIQNLHHEGNLYFNYAGFPTRFARGLYSWDAEEMVRVMKLFAGHNLRLGPEWKRMVQESWYNNEEEG